MKKTELEARIQVLEDEVERLERLMNGLGVILNVDIHKGDLEILSILAAELGYEEREELADKMIKVLNKAEKDIPDDIKEYFGREDSTDFKFGGF